MAYAWGQERLGNLYKRRGTKNDGSIGPEKIITVASMSFSSDVRISTEEYLKTYNVMNGGDVAFEGHKNKEFSHGRFVENDIGNGIVSHIFDVYMPIKPYSLPYWKYAINNEKIMRPILVQSTQDGRMMCNLIASDFFNQYIRVPSVEEQEKIGHLLASVDGLLSLHQRSPFWAQTSPANALMTRSMSLFSSSWMMWR